MQLKGCTFVFLVVGVVSEEEVCNLDGAAGDVNRQEDAGDGFVGELDAVVSQGANNQRERGLCVGKEVPDFFGGRHLDGEGWWTQGSVGCRCARAELRIFEAQITTVEERHG